VLVTRVHKLVDQKTCARRYEHIRDFEALLVESGTTILKFFLHISKEEQLARFAQRLDDPGRNWKISESDYSERELWDDYIDVFEDSIGATSTANAPWYVIPATTSGFAISRCRRSSPKSADLGLAFPAPSVNLRRIKRTYAPSEGK
jgi:polyphosphate kinase 2 (PPK2 family)